MESDSTVIYRHFNAPSRAFTQFSHDIIRHPRLGSDAVRLLTWQLSLPDGARESLSRTAERARIGACAFTRAKRQLKEEGFVHERRVQIAGGRWATQQLVSSHPLTADQAAKLLARTPVASPQVAPTPRKPAVGEPMPPLTDGHPKKEPGEDTSNLPPKTVEESPRLEEARALIGALPLLSPALRHIPPGMRDELARLAARWLDAGHTPTKVHEHIRHGLPADGTPVHRPGGLVRYLLRDVPPRELPPPTPVPAPAPGNRLSPWLQGARECAGAHTQTTLFRPVGDETHCAACVSQAAQGPGVVVAVAP
ncbi:hypothetical protein [Streptomyces sp. TLI_105]|uniref:hypothetical protein n=1 Tax=Streptomyces sp. TLI_105 TaxID=1881019 RepID=UPI00089529E8|nr:hypothetical protein [Streptomyces sp. TLI_105]SEC82933.1 hypothetical protein SAMN05428939_3390 [Streptomyces sp. TLI_105]